MPHDVKQRLGASTWDVIHSFPYTLYDSPAHSLHYALLVEMVFDLFPCASCREHIGQRRGAWVRELSAILDTISTVFPIEEVISEVALWAFRVHNEVRSPATGARAWASLSAPARR